MVLSEDDIHRADLIGIRSLLRENRPLEAIHRLDLMIEELDEDGDSDG